MLSGAPIAAKTKEYGIEYTKQPPYEVLCTKWLSFADVIRLKKVEEMVEEYYEEKGYYLNSPSRTYRYEILLDFADRFDAGHRELYVELLTYDLYLREK